MQAERPNSGRSLQARIGRHVANLGSVDQDLSVQAERFLLRFYSDTAVEPLIAACSDPDPRMRYRVVHVLGKTRSDRAFDAILALTLDPDPDVRYDAAMALGDLGDPRGVDPLVKLILYDSESPEGMAASIAIARLGEVAVPAMIQILRGPRGENRRTATYILGSIGGEAAVGILEGLLSDYDSDVRAAAADARESAEA